MAIPCLTKFFGGFSAWFIRRRFLAVGQFSYPEARRRSHARRGVMPDYAKYYAPLLRFIIDLNAITLTLLLNILIALLA